MGAADSQECDGWMMSEVVVWRLPDVAGLLVRVYSIIDLMFLLQPCLRVLAL
jgi:hypothetical protein